MTTYPLTEETWVPETPGELPLRRVLNVYAEAGEGSPQEAEQVVVYAITDEEVAEAAAEISQVPMPPTGIRRLRQFEVMPDAELRALEAAA